MPRRYILSEKQRRYFRIKNVMDRVIGTVGLFLFSPVFLLIIIAIKLEDGLTAPVFFSQKRIGINGSYFQMYKFRSMRLDTPHDRPTHLLENPEQYITGVGCYLRKLSLDELPQLWNISKGELSVVGPRPALWNQDDLIELREKYGVHQVKPGLTGYAQITGRDELTIEEKAARDAYYVQHFGFRMDAACFLRTFRAVFRGDGIVEGGTGALEKGTGRKTEDKI